MNKQKETTRLGFVWEGAVVGPDGRALQRGKTKNIIPQVGIDFLVSLIRGTGTPVSGWYVGVGENDYVPTPSITSAGLQSQVGESQAYSESDRPLWDNTYDGVSILTNLDSRAEFSFTAAKRLHTGFLVANSTKGSAAGQLLSIARFQTPYDVPAGSTFRLGISITLLPAI